MQVSELSLVIASSVEVYLISMDCQPEAVSGFRQSAIPPLLPILGLEVVGLHGLNRGESTAADLESSGPKKAYKVFLRVTAP